MSNHLLEMSNIICYSTDFVVQTTQALPNVGSVCKSNGTNEKKGSKCVEYDYSTGLRVPDEGAGTEISWCVNLHVLPTLAEAQTEPSWPEAAVKSMVWNGLLGCHSQQKFNLTQGSGCDAALNSSAWHVAGSFHRGK